MFVGIDIGGTKTHVLVEEDNHVILDRVLPTSAWQCGGLLDDDENVTRLLATIADVAGAASAPLVIGAHGLDSEWQTLEFQLSLTSRHLGPVRAVNDVELLGPAGGFDDAIAVIVGTGSKVVAHTSEGASLSAGGYGFLLSDPGSAAMLARQAVRAVLNARDAGLQPDALAHGLMNHFGVDDEIALSYAFTSNARLTSWGALAPIVFAAADDGSTLAAKVIDDAAKELAFGGRTGLRTRRSRRRRHLRWRRHLEPTTILSGIHPTHRRPWSWADGAPADRRSRDRGSRARAKNAYPSTVQ